MRRARVSAAGVDCDLGTLAPGETRTLQVVGALDRADHGRGRSTTPSASPRRRTIRIRRATRRRSRPAVTQRSRPVQVRQTRRLVDAGRWERTDVHDDGHQQRSVRRDERHAHGRTAAPADRGGACPTRADVTCTRSPVCTSPARSPHCRPARAAPVRSRSACRRRSRQAISPTRPPSPARPTRP